MIVETDKRYEGAIPTCMYHILRMKKGDVDIVARRSWRLGVGGKTDKR